MKERNDFEQWNDYVNSFERNEAWRMSLEIANMVLEAYFQSRDSFPGTSLMGEDLVDDSKTTDEIVEEVSTMMDRQRDRRYLDALPRFPYQNHGGRHRQMGHLAGYEAAAVTHRGYAPYPLELRL